MKKKTLIVGAGLSGAVVARELADSGFPSWIIDARPHVAGNCHTERCPQTGIMEHIYGPHIFNTDDEQVWNYVNRFTIMVPFVNRVKASCSKGIFSLPINLHTINQYFGKRFSPAEAREFVAKLGDSSIQEPRNFEEQALKFIGRDLYETFFKGYTIKQWGCDPTALPASILQRLPVRFNYNDNYYNVRWQGIPLQGYTAMVENILDHELIEVTLKTPWDHAMRADFDKVVFTGPIDAFFNYRHGRLGYRTVSWDRQIHDHDFQGNPVINYPDLNQAWTRIHEHRHFAPWESHEKSIVLTEFSKETEFEDIPYYPKRLAQDKIMLDMYQEDAAKEKNLYFLGRLATYRYLDMDDVIAEAQCFSKTLISVSA